MAAPSLERTPAPPAVADGADGIHNTVLIRTHEPRRGSHGWIVPAVLGVAILASALIFVAGHPAGPLVNHAVAAAPTSFTPTRPG